MRELAARYPYGHQMIHDMIRNEWEEPVRLSTLIHETAMSVTESGVMVSM